MIAALTVITFLVVFAAASYIGFRLVRGYERRPL